MTPDIINGLFEFGGAIVSLMNVREIVRTKKVVGVRWEPTAFFSAWGIWNLYFYPHLGQWFSFAGGAALVYVNVMWIVFAIWYGRTTCTSRA